MMTPERLRQRVFAFHPDDAPDFNRPVLTKEERAAFEVAHATAEAESKARLAALERFFVKLFGEPVKASDYVSQGHTYADERYWLLELDDPKVFVRYAALVEYVLFGFHDQVATEVADKLYTSVGYCVVTGASFTIVMYTGDDRNEFLSRGRNRV
jgi:hypothetical protein